MKMKKEMQRAAIFRANVILITVGIGTILMIRKYTKVKAD